MERVADREIHLNCLYWLSGVAALCKKWKKSLLHSHRLSRSLRLCIYYVCVFLSSTEVDDMIRKSTNLLLTRTLSHCLQYAIKKKNVGLAEVMCVCVCVFFQKSGQIKPQWSLQKVRHFSELRKMWGVSVLLLWI